MPASVVPAARAGVLVVFGLVRFATVGRVRASVTPSIVSVVPAVFIGVSVVNGQGRRVMVRTI